MVTMVSLPCRSRRAKALWINDVEEFKLFSGWVWTCLESIVTVSWNHPAGFSLFASGQFLIEAYSPLLQMGIEDFLQRRFFLRQNFSGPFKRRMPLPESQQKLVFSVLILWKWVYLLHCSIFTCEKMLAWRRWDMKHMISCGIRQEWLYVFRYCANSFSSGSRDRQQQKQQRTDRKGNKHVQKQQRNFKCNTSRLCITNQRNEITSKNNSANTRNLYHDPISLFSIG